MSDVYLSRSLVRKNGSEESLAFTVSISLVRDDDGAKCLLDSQNVIFNGLKSASGVDDIDAINIAIKKLDLLLEVANLDLYWPDGSKYVRVSGEWG
jgi:hypothetical protein